MVLRRTMGSLLGTLLLLALPGAATAIPLRGLADDGSTLARIEAAYLDEVLDREEYLLYRLYRVTDKRRLPPEFVAPAGQERPMRCATPLIREVLAEYGTFSPEGQAAAGELLLVPGPLSYDTYPSTNFQVVVGDAGGVSQNTIDFWHTTLETSWTAEVDQAGFQRPPCTDSYLLDVWLANTGDDVPELEQDVYGYVSLYNTDCPYMVVHPEYAWQPDPQGAAEVTAAHEFFHTVQAGYEWGEEDWWVESTAVWAEELVFDGVDDYLQYINGGGSWLEYPELALVYDGGTHEYGDVIFALYLAENHGGATAIREIWDRCVSQSPLDAVDAYLVSQGTSLDEAFVDFSVRLSTRDFEEAASFDDVWASNVDFYPVQVTVDQYPPESYGSSHIAFIPDGGPGDFELAFVGTPDNDGQAITWGVALIAVDGNGYTHQVLTVDGNGEASGTVADFGGAVDEIRVVSSVLGESGNEPGEGGVPYEMTAWLYPYGDDDDDDTGDDDTGDDDTGDDDTGDDDDDDTGDDDDDTGDDDDDIADDDDDDEADDDDDDDAPPGPACACRNGGRATNAVSVSLLVGVGLALHRRRIG